MSPQDSTTGGRDLQPYWSDYTKAISSQLWLPTGTDSPASAPSSLKQMLEQNGGELLVLNQRDLSPSEELTQDLLTILTVLSARASGLRRYRKEIQEDKSLPNPNPETHA